MNRESKADFYLEKLRPMVGGTITNLVRSGPSSGPTDHEEFFGLIITMPNGTEHTFFLLSDDEGNGPGSFEIQSKPKSRRRSA